MYFYLNNQFQVVIAFLVFYVVVIEDKFHLWFIDNFPFRYYAFLNLYQHICMVPIVLFQFH